MNIILTEADVPTGMLQAVRQRAEASHRTLPNTLVDLIRSGLERTQFTVPSLPMDPPTEESSIPAPYDLLNPRGTPVTPAMIPTLQIDPIS